MCPEFLYIKITKGQKTESNKTIDTKNINNLFSIVGINL